MAQNFKLSDPSLLAEKGWINGKQVKAKSGTAPFEVLDPATDQCWAKCEAMDADDVDLAVEAAVAVAPTWSRTPPRERARIILKLDRLLRDAKDDLCQLTVMETGKAKIEAEAEFEYAATYSWHFVGEAERMTGQMLRGNANPNTRFWTTRQPIPVVGLLVAWNFPVVLALRKMVTALAAGCTMVLKPSPESPVTAVALAILAQRAGVPDGVVNIVTASCETTPSVGLRLCEHPDIGKISFTGSTTVGKVLMKQCASTLKKMTLELGGNGGWTVFEDADLEKAADALLANKLRSAGQVCVCANRVFVQRKVYEKFSELMKVRLESLKVGHGLEPGVMMGSMTTRRGVENAVKLIEDAVAHGGRVITGGKRFGSGYHLEPTLLVGAGHNALVYRTEMFAPICSLYPFDTEEEVVKLVNATDMGLTNYVFTQDINRVFRLSDAFQSGTVSVNMANANVAESPFGGIKHSGFGKEGGIGFGIEEYTTLKTTALNLA